jgi:site-specific recombinase XerD/regulator of replication initiation timing
MKRKSVVMAEVKQFVSSNELLKDWLRKYPEASQRSYSYETYRFFRWLKQVKNISMTPEALIEDHIKSRKSKNVLQRKKYARLVKEYVFENPDHSDYSDKTKQGIIAAISSLFNYCEAPLTTSRSEFKTEGLLKYEYKQIGVEQARKIIDAAPQREKAVFLTMLQGGFRVGDLLSRVNYRWEEIKPQLEEGKDPVKITMYGGKYWAYITTDAIQELKKYILERGEPREGEPIFVTSSGKPLTPQQVIDSFHRACRNGGIITEQSKNQAHRYPVNLHMLRKLFKSEASVAGRGIDQRYVEFFMGHAGGLAQIGGIYDKSPELHEEMFEQEYRKIAPYVNIYTGVQTLEQRISKIEEERAKLKEKIGEEEFEHLRKIGIVREKQKKLKETMHNGGDCVGKQKIVSESELPELLAEGFHVAAVLPSGKVVVEAKD